ncbi:MAG: alginate lyase family protein [Phycisphaeraceae bacterium]|nr:alginate lyase family protein [Phycisphaeraceae bacterium]
MTAAFDFELDMSDPDLWTIDTVHLGTRQVKITYDERGESVVITPTWSASDRESVDTGVRNIEHSRLHLYQLIQASDCTQTEIFFEISMPKDYVDEGRLELVFALQAGAKGDYLFNGRTFTMADFCDSGGTYTKLIVRAPDFNEPPDKLRAIERVNFIFERRGSMVSAPIKIRAVAIDLNKDKVTAPAKEVRIKNPRSFYEFTYTTQSDVDDLQTRVSAESMDITRHVNDAGDGVALIPQWKEGQIPEGHSGNVVLYQSLGAPHHFDPFEVQYVMNVPRAYFAEGKLDLYLFIQAGEAGFYRWSGTQRSLASFSGQAGQDVVLTMTEQDFLTQGKKRNQIEVMGLQLNRNGSTVTEPIMLKRITVTLPKEGEFPKVTEALSNPVVGSPSRPSSGMIFIHPGALNSRAELDFVKARIQAAAQPWKAEFDQMRHSGYATRGPHGLTHINSRSSDASVSLEDAIASYTQALLWYFTEDEVYARRCIAILNSWSNLQGFTHGSDQDRLHAGYVGAVLAPAAEIMRAYPGWTPSDIGLLQAMFKRAFYPQLNTASRWNGNVDLTQIDAMMAISVFNEDETEFNQGLARLKARSPAYFYLVSDGDKPKPIEGDGGNAQQFWSSPAKWIDGLTQETCRDNGRHAQFGLGSALHAAEVAWHQGMDVYSENQERYTAAMELMAFQFLTGSMQGTCTDNTATLHRFGIWEMGYNHYHNRAGVSLPNTRKLIQTQIRPRASRTICNLVYETLTHADLPHGSNGGE